MPALRVVPETATENQEQVREPATLQGFHTKKADKRSWRRNVPDCVVGPHADPVGDGAVLALLLRQLLLDAEGLVGRLQGGDDTASAKR